MICQGCQGHRPGLCLANEAGPNAPLTDAVVEAWPGCGASRHTVPPKLSKPLEISFQGPSWKLFDPPKAGISMDQLTTYNILIHLRPYNLYDLYDLYNI